MKTELEEKLKQLQHLWETAQNKKILLEEMQLVSQKAFDLQDDLMVILSGEEAIETDIEAVQDIFETREIIWDTVNKIALREKEIKDATLSRETYEQKRSDFRKEQEESACGCHEHHGHCCCRHEHEATEGHTCHCHDHEATEGHTCHCHEDGHHCGQDATEHKCCHKHGGCCHHTEEA